jgi:hypothetical protein
MKRHRVLLFSLILGLTGIPASAPGQKQIMMHGFGSRSCGLWMEVRANRYNPSLDRELLAQFPDGYRHLAYLQTQNGDNVKMDMPGSDGPEVEALYASGGAWLAGRSS